jgi:hypothetical protein
MENILILILAHYIADYPLQGDFLGVYKSKYDYLLFVHCFIWTGIMCLVLQYLDIFAIWKMIYLFVGHWVVDRWKCRHKDNKELGLTKLLWIDQSIHFLQVLLVSIG